MWQNSFPLELRIFSGATENKKISPHFKIIYSRDQQKNFESVNVSLYFFWRTFKIKFFKENLILLGFQKLRE
jgi:hypothetical protein